MSGFSNQHGVQGFLWFNSGVTGISQSDNLLTIGEAAEQASVALLELREHIRSGRIATVRGQRLGDEIPLISLEALVHIYPSAARRRRRPLGTLAERGIAVLGLGGAMQGDAPADGASSLPKGAERRRKPAAVPAADDAAERSDLEVAKLEQEIERLRQQVNAAQDQNQTLMVDLDSASAEAQRVLDGAMGPAARRRKRRDRSQREQAELDSALQGVASGRSALGWFSALAGILVAAVLVAWLRNPVHAATLAPEPPALDPYALREAIVVRSLRDGAALERKLAAKRRARQRRINEQLADPANPTGNAAQDGSLGTTAAADLAAGLTGGNGGTKQAKAAADEHAPGPSPVPADQRITAPVSTGEPCEMFILTAEGQPLREVLGPCLGSWNPADDAVAGVHRQDGKHWCLHHTVIARDLGGSIVRAKEIAEFAEKDGLVPPLMQLRVNRTAAAFLEARTGTWIESGFESGSGSDHRTIRLVDRDRWRLESWVRLPLPDGTAQRRGFRMQVELNGSEWLDRELDFEWMD